LKKHHFTCIVCPAGCQIVLTEEKGRIVEVLGGECKLGHEYARKEFTNPERVLTTTVRVEAAVLPVLPVRTEKPIPKKLIKDCMKKLANVTVKAPIKCGEIIYKNILDTGVNIIASRDLPAKEDESNEPSRPRKTQSFNATRRLS
jgi:CxxC motif-containing protein